MKYFLSRMAKRLRVLSFASWLVVLPFARESSCAEASEPPRLNSVVQLDHQRRFVDRESSSLSHDVTRSVPDKTDENTTSTLSSGDVGGLRQEPAGEDLGQASEARSLQRIAQYMQHVQRRLAEANTAPATAELQARVVRELDALLAQAQNEASRKGQSTSPPTNSSPRRSPSPGAGPRSDQVSSTEGVLSQAKARLAAGDVVPATPAEQDRLLQQAWGDLPAMERQQLQSTRPETFLPKYSRLIEEYFRRLAEDRDRHNQ